jgi:hypothetical protein
MEFREGDFTSHKPLIGLSEVHATPMHQENSLIHLENFGTINFSKIHLLSDQISPVHTGITKQPLARPPGSLEVKNYKESNNTISAKFLLQALSYTFTIQKRVKNYRKKTQKELESKFYSSYKSSITAPIRFSEQFQS